MQITKISIQNFRGIRELSIPMANFSCVIGENNAGKSSILQALDIFFNNPGLRDSDFYRKEETIRVEVTFDEIKDEDLGRLTNEHRSRIAEHVSEGRLSLSRLYSQPGKGVLRMVAPMPIDKRYWPDAIAEVTAKKSGQELRANAVFHIPDLADVLPSRPTQKQVREEVEKLIAALPADQKKPDDVPLVTGMDKSIHALLPEVIYIPAVKDLSDDLKTAETASFGKLIGILFNTIKPKLANIDALFSTLENLLNVTEVDGVEVDDRLKDVISVERAVEKNLQEAFPETSIRIEIPPPDLKSVLNNAQIAIDDGVRSGFKSKGDGLRRSITFAILRAYADMRSQERMSDPSLTPRPYLLLFEEPELFLHPRAQIQLFEALKVFAADNHVMVSTHSSAFFSPQATGTFVKLIKDRSATPPCAKAFPVDLSDLRLKDQFQMVRQENNDAAFFCESILLVEGDSDHIVIPHIARTLNPSWNFAKKSVAIARVGGKHNIQRYRSFFERFGVSVSALVDLDALAEGFDKLGASAPTTKMRNELMQDVGNMLTGTHTSDIDLSGNQLRKIKESPTIKEIWAEAKKQGELFNSRECTWEDLKDTVDKFFHQVVTRDARLEVLKELRDGPMADKQKLVIEALRKEGIYVLSKGAIEAYYPRPAAGDKLRAAQEYCDELTDPHQIRQLVNTDGESGDCEFDLIFANFFGERVLTHQRPSPDLTSSPTSEIRTPTNVDS
ncbi:ATP-dependent endonuclease [Streptomyces europaeiscabiei]|uniref:ATP-dependent nuclease n=1 Tax=Streptomyces europaeiscabiei TaxID=146819 RepID=UPI000A50CE8A|nr:AAA family ATPase [Streptomyces europaeiscabiei]MDX3670535.1 AAA family ATPase [Streptomyces europaeiscabiei]